VRNKIILPVEDIDDGEALEVRALHKADTGNEELSEG
jgi:hypothetical protein